MQHEGGVSPRPCFARLPLDARGALLYGHALVLPPAGEAPAKRVMRERPGPEPMPRQNALPHSSAALRETAADTFPRWGKDKEAAAGDRKGEAKRRAPLRGNVGLRRRGWRPRQPAVRLALLRPLPSAALRGKAAATSPDGGGGKAGRLRLRKPGFPFPASPPGRRARSSPPVRQGRPGFRGSPPGFPPAPRGSASGGE